MSTLAPPAPARATARAPGAIDVHQHLWPESLLAALARRRRPPLIRRDGRGFALRVAGEPEWPVDPADHDPGRRLRTLAADGVERALVALSSPLGIEALPAEEAEDLIAAYHDGVADLPRGLAAWAAAALEEPDPDALAAQLDAGRVGLCLPAAALATPDGAARCAPLLSVLERRGAPVFLHPGPAPWAPAPAAVPGAPAWWPALTGYVGQMQAAWLGWSLWVRPAHPRLRALFAMLAGLAPLHAERLASRGVATRRDPLVFLDTSSYGPAACAAVAAVVGEDALVHGSDRPVVTPVAAPVTPDDARRRANPARLLAPAPAGAA